jgi:pyridoxal phosphate enzyme (YggS family)
MELGLRDFGENQVKMAEEKAAALGPSARFHLIGHLQRNKVRRALRLFRSIHSVDSLKLAEALSRRLGGEHLPVLLEVNIGSEEQKHGFLPEELLPALEHISPLPGLCVEGFMAVPPYRADPEEVRPYFRRLREIRDEALRHGGSHGKLETLSMGMSGDFEVAVEEGATEVRVGSALFEQVKPISRRS